MNYKISKFDKNYHRSYYQEKRKYKMNKTRFYDKTPINNVYLLSEIERHLNDYFDYQLLKEFDINNVKHLDDNDDIKIYFPNIIINDFDLDEDYLI